MTIQLLGRLGLRVQVGQVLPGDHDHLTAAQESKQQQEDRVLTGQRGLGLGASAELLIDSDYRRMIYGDSRQAAEKARLAFSRKWKLRSQAVSASFEEAGDELFTFTGFPTSQWKALRTTNALERQFLAQMGRRFGEQVP